MYPEEIEICVKFLAERSLVYVIRNWLRIRWGMIRDPDFKAIVEDVIEKRNLTHSSVEK